MPELLSEDIQWVVEGSQNPDEFGWMPLSPDGQHGTIFKAREFRDKFARWWPALRIVKRRVTREVIE